MTRRQVTHTIRAAGFILAVAVCAPAEAQVGQGYRPERPYQGVFGQDTGTWAQQLTANLSLGGGWDSDVLAGARGRSTPSPDPEEQQSGPFASGSAGLSYSLTQGAFSLGASAGSAIRFYGNNLSEPYIGSYSGGVQATYRFTDRTSISASQSAGYMPFDSRMLFVPEDELVGEPGSPDFDTAASGDNYLALQSQVSLAHELSTRSSLQFAYAYRYADYATTEDRRHSGRARYTYSLAEGLGLRLGYGYEIRERRDLDDPDALPEDTDRHLLDVGIDFNRALSLSRRTTLSFGAGATVVNDIDTVDDLSTNRIQAIGNVRLNHEIGRSWQASIGYGRSVRFVDYFDRPVLSDAVYATFGGLIGRRVSFNSSARASFGSVGLGGEDNRADTYGASAGLMAAVSRYLGVGVSYAYYQHDYGRDVVLPEGVPRAVRRHVAQVYLSAWAPIFRRGGRLDAAR